MTLRVLATSLAILLVSCDGPHEEAGEKADIQAGDSDSAASLKAGPREKAGEALDEKEAKLDK